MGMLKKHLLKKSSLCILGAILCVVAAVTVVVLNGSFKSEAANEYDEKVLEAQKWVNKTYSGTTGYTKITEDGYTGQEVTTALTMGLQKEIGVTVDGGFGNGTLAACKTINTSTTNQNLVKIIQYGLFCKGYNPNAATGIYADNTSGAVNELLADIGLPQTGVVEPVIIKALLSNNAYKLAQTGNEDARKVQQLINADYSKTTGIIPCDGVFSVSSNTAIKKALQLEINKYTGTKLDIDGGFGPGTTSACPIISQGDERVNLVKILQWILTIYGYKTGEYDGVYDVEVTEAVKQFQTYTCLEATGTADVSTIKGLFVSYGDETRRATGLDTITTLTQANITALKNKGYTTVARYLTNASGSGSLMKATDVDEVKLIINNKMTYVPIYQTIGNKVTYFTASQGTTDAKAAITAAKNLGLPTGTAIYFAVDCDANISDINTFVLPYFKAVASTFTSYKNIYKVGIYGARNTCITTAASGYTVSSFVSDMSSGHIANVGYKLPSDWAFDQIASTTEAQISLDKLVMSGRNPGVNNIARMSVTSASVGIGYTKALTVTYAPATSQAVTWTSSNSNVATVSSSGVVTPKNTGTTVITATSNGRSASCTISVPRRDITKSTVSGIATRAYTGTARTQAVVVKYGKTTLKAGTDYTVSYKNNINPTESASVIITGKGNYTGTITKTFAIRIPQVAGLKLSSNNTNSIKFTWNKVSVATGYTIVSYNTTTKKYTTIATLTTNTNTYTHSKLSAGTAYHYKVCANRKINGKNVRGAYSSFLSTGTRPVVSSGISVKALGSAKIKTTWNKINASSGYQVYRSTSLKGTYTHIYTATKNSVVTYTNANLKKGTTYYYKVRAYKTVAGKNIYGNFTAAKGAKCK